MHQIAPSLDEAIAVAGIESVSGYGRRHPPPPPNTNSKMISRISIGWVALKVLNPVGDRFPEERRFSYPDTRRKAACPGGPEREVS